MAGSNLLVADPSTCTFGLVHQLLTLAFCAAVSGYFWVVSFVIHLVSRRPWRLPKLGCACVDASCDVVTSGWGEVDFPLLL